MVWVHTRVNVGPSLAEHSKVYENLSGDVDVDFWVPGSVDAVKVTLWFSVS